MLENRRYAPLDAAKSGTPCPTRRQRTLESLLHCHAHSNVPIMASSPSTSQGLGLPTSPPTVTHSKGQGKKGESRDGKGKAPLNSHTPAPSGSVISTRHMGYHHSDPFRNNFSAYVRSRMGGSDQRRRQHNCAKMYQSKFFSWVIKEFDQNFFLRNGH
jgi:hypothetical protein